ncbi:MAG: DUF4838 domain-containing protein [Lentisphaeria bacterium]|nr:DUF4838 domain-containing protein [Lentisphaeria bacterium]
MRKIVFLSLLFLLPAATFSLVPRTVGFDSKGKKPPLIVLPGEKTSPQQEIAAGELLEFLEKVVSVKAKVVRTPDENAPFQFLLADLSLPEKEFKVPQEIRKKLLEHPAEDAFYFRVDNNTFSIIGKTPRALVYGSCFFLDRYLGVTFLYPGKQGESYVKKDSLFFSAEVDDLYAPFTPFRIAAYTIHDKKDVPWKPEDMIQWQYRNLLLPLPRTSQIRKYASIMHRELPRSGHMTLCNAVPSSLYETHPEYFPLIDGKRVKCRCFSRQKKGEKGEKLPWVQRCVSNPEVRKRVIDHILSMVRKEPKGTFGISAADTVRSWCSCEACRKYGTLNGKFSTSHLFHRFFRDVTSAVLKEQPDAKLWVYIYSDYRDLPADPAFRYDDRVSAIYYAHGRCIAHPIAGSSCPINPPYHEKYIAWGKVFSRVGLCDYYGNANTPYCPHEYNLAADAPERIRRKDWGERSHITANRFFHNALFYLVMARLWWDPRTDVEQFIEEVFRRYYGKSASPMLKFQKMKKVLWENAPGHAWYPGPNRGAYCLLLPENQRKMERYLAEAEKLAQGDPLLLARIRMEKEAFLLYWVKSAEEMRKNHAASRIIPARPADKEMRIDGVLDESAWKKTGSVNQFISPYTENKLAEDTTLRVLYDKKHFYISVECMNDKAWSKLVAKETRNDVSSIADDDSVEIFLCDETNGVYYQFIINTLGKMYDAKMMDRSFDTGSKVAAKVYDDRYIVELAVPVEMTGIKEIRDGQRWKIHVWRNIRNLQPPASVDRGGIDGKRPHSTHSYRNLVIGGREILKNSDFCNLTEEALPADWRITTKKNFSLIRGSSGTGNTVVLKGCKIYQRMTLSDTGHFSRKKNPACRIQVTVSASGKGMLELIPSTGIPGNPEKPFHRPRKTMKSPLTEQEKEHVFSFDMEEGEEGYLFVGAASAKIRWVSAVKVAAREPPSAGK